MHSSPLEIYSGSIGSEAWTSLENDFVLLPPGDWVGGEPRSEEKLLFLESRGFANVLGDRSGGSSHILHLTTMQIDRNMVRETGRIHVDRIVYRSSSGLKL